MFLGIASIPAKTPFLPQFVNHAPARNLFPERNPQNPGRRILVFRSQVHNLEYHDSEQQLSPKLMDSKVLFPAVDRNLYPDIEPYSTGLLKVSEMHSIFYEQSGNPDGHPVVFFHGGPGGRTSPSNRKFFDPTFYRIILFDQRGAGKSTPHACLEENTTWDLIEDAEKLREHLKVPEWLVFGGSWGSTLALAYSQSHPDKVTGMVLRGIFLSRKKEIDWFYEGGASAIFPDAWESFRDLIPASERGCFVDAYHKRLNSDDKETQYKAARAWTKWEMRTAHLLPNEVNVKRGGNDEFCLAFARIENHYFVNKGFFPSDSFLLDNIEKIKHINTVIVQGRYDVCCPLTSAWDLHKAWPEADLKIVPDAGHSANEPGISKELVAATNKFKYIKGAADIVKTLPGYPEDTLPFHLETGYIGVGEKEQVQLFYYFVESERNPDKDPVVLWLTGGPGCSGFSGFVYEIGPLRFDIQSFDGSLPRLVLNPYSWTKVANIIFLDTPVGTGFSYATTPDGFISSDTKATIDNYTFLKKWLSIHPRFIKNRLYIGGDSYAGKTVTLLALQIANGNDGGLEQRMTLKGYLIGNPRADKDLENNERIPYAHRMALISDEYFELAKSSCKGNYTIQDSSNEQCRYALHLCEECIKNVNQFYILDPNCNLFSPKRDYILEDDPDDFLVMFEQEEQWCRNNNYLDSAVWANDQSVQEALHIRNGTIREWKRCNRSLVGYEQDVGSVVQYHQILSQKGFQILVYSGDHDMTMPYMATLKWIRSLNLTVENNWRPWTVAGQVAGYTEKYKNGESYLTFATVKGAGHAVPEYKPKQSLAMIKRWFSLFPL